MDKSKYWPRRERSADWFTTLFIALVLMVLWGNWVTTDPVAFSSIKSEFPEWKKLAIEMLVSRSETMASWGIALIASLGFILNYVSGKSGSSLPWYLSIIGFLAFLCAFLSVSFSHLVFDAVIRPLILGEDPTENVVAFNLLRCQFVTLVLSVVLFVAFILKITFPDLLGDEKKG